MALAQGGQFHAESVGRGYFFLAVKQGDASVAVDGFLFPVRKGMHAFFTAYLAQVIRNRFLRGVALYHAPLVQQYDAFAQRIDKSQVVGDKHDGFALFAQFAYLGTALALKFCIADGQHFVGQEDIGIHERRHGKGNAHIHAARIGFHRLVNEFADPGETYNFIINRIYLGVAHAQEPRVEINVFPSCQHRVEPRA